MMTSYAILLSTFCLLCAGSLCFVLCSLGESQLSTPIRPYQVQSTKHKAQKPKTQVQTFTTYDKPDVPVLQPQTFRGTSHKPYRAQSTHLQQWPDRLLIQQRGPQVLPADRSAS